MKRIFGMLLTIAVVMLMVGTLCAEQYLEKIPRRKCFVYSGRVVELKTEVVDLAEMIESLQVKGGEFIPPVVILHTYTVTYFTVWPVDDNAKSYQEKIENGDGKDMSAMIAVVQEAFTSGEMIHVVKCCDSVQPLYDGIDALKKELDRLSAVRDQKLTVLRSEYSSAMGELFAQLRAHKISLPEFCKLRKELLVKYSSACQEVENWYAATNEQLNDQIASLEAEIEYILNNPKLRSVSIDKEMMKISE